MRGASKRTKTTVKVDIDIIIHEENDGGYWAEVPALDGCFSQGDTMTEMKANIREAIECHLEALALKSSSPTSPKKLKPDTPKPRAPKARAASK